MGLVKEIWEEHDRLNRQSDLEPSCDWGDSLLNIGLPSCSNPMCEAPPPHGP